MWGWICARWRTVYVVCMGVCASAGSVGFWPIIPAALRSQLSSHAHFWHSFLDMITIHLPLWVWLCVEYFHHSRVELEQCSRNEQLTPTPTRACSSLSHPHTPFPSHPTVSTPPLPPLFSLAQIPVALQ